MTDIEIENKTLYTSYDEVTRMMDFCSETDPSGNYIVSKNFYDWYLKEDAFFMRCGVFIMDGIYSEKSKHKFICVFNFEDVNCSKFELLNYKTHESLSAFSFYRESNLDMNNIKAEVHHISYHALQRLGEVLFPPHELKERIEAITKKVKKSTTGKRNFNKKKLLANELESLMRRLHYGICLNAIRWIYATMYYSSKHQPELIEYAPEVRAEEHQEQTAVIASKYVYTGYVNLNKPRYRAAIKKDDNEPAREYQRHIQKWTVRGHYRRTPKGLIWIEAHTKGEGELEKRVYGTEDESHVNIVPKVFEVEKKVVAPDENDALIDMVPIENIPYTPVAAKVYAKEQKVAGWNIRKVNPVATPQKTFYEKIRLWTSRIFKWIVSKKK